MTKGSDLPPGPLDFEQDLMHGFVYLKDGTGKKIATLYGTEDRKLALARWVVTTYNREAMVTEGRDPLTQLAKTCGNVPYEDG